MIPPLFECIEENAGGRWVHCSPSLIEAGVSCDKTPRRACACPINGSHDHYIAQEVPRVDGASTVIAAMVVVTGDGRTTADYRDSMAKGGPMWGAWKNKPHRLVYDLCCEIERREEERLAMLGEAEDPPLPPGFAACGRLAEKYGGHVVVDPVGGTHIDEVKALVPVQVPIAIVWNGTYAVLYPGMTFEAWFENYHVRRAYWQTKRVDNNAFCWPMRPETA
jgi:hypothetical protein